MALQIRRGTEAERTAGGGVVFAEGELVYITNTDALYIGNGSTAGGVKLTDNAGSVLGTYITADTINSTLDLQQNLDLNGNNIVGTGNINITGTINATGNVTIGDDAGTDTVDFAAQITSSLTPNADSTFNIGAMNARWNNGYFTGLWVDGQINAVALNGDVVADDSTVMVDASANTFTGDLTGDVTGNVVGDLTGNVVGNLTGNVTGNSTGYHTGDVKGSVFGDDSTPIVDAVNNTLAGNLTGDVTGNLTGNVTGNLKGSISNDPVIETLQGPADAVIRVFDITATGVIAGNVTGDLTGNVVGDLTGNVVGNLTGDLTGSVFADNSTLLVDAVAGSIPGANIAGTLTNNLTGNATGDHSGTFTGNVFTTLIDSDDSSPIVITPRVDFSADVIVNNSIRLTTTGFIGSETVVIDNTGTVNCLKLETQSIAHTGGGGINFNDRVEFNEDATFGKIVTFADNVSVQTITGEVEGKFAVETFSGDPDDDASVADLANYDKHFEATIEKVTFGVPAQFANLTTAERNGLTPLAGMVVFNTTVTKLQVYTGSAWTDLH